MSPDQRARLLDLVPKMITIARRHSRQNDFSAAMFQVGELGDFLRGSESRHTAEEWLAIAEKAAEGHDKPGTIRMPSLAAVMSGKPPEQFKEQ